MLQEGMAFEHTQPAWILMEGCVEWRETKPVLPILPVGHSPTCYPPNCAQTTSRRTLNRCPAYEHISK